VLETVTKEEEKKRQKELAKVQPTPTLTRHTGLSGGAPDNVRCAWRVFGESAALGNRRRRTAKNHRTVRWCTILFGEPTVVSANGRPRNLRATRGLLQWSAGAPDCPVCTGQCPVRQSAQWSNGRLCPIWKKIVHRTCYSGCPVAHRTVRCATRQKARIAFLIGLQRLLAALGL
jgi:hypothetical protein